MRVLHFYPDNDNMIAKYVTMLTEHIGLEAEQHSTTQAADAKTLLQGAHYDILHLHGCWRNASRMVVNTALKAGTRLVVTPHGQLEPWEMGKNRWNEKLPKRLFYQHDIIRRAYAVIIHGRMEEKCMQELRWNSRYVIIRNALITRSIQPLEMARQTFAVYQKVIDSNTLQLMDDNMRHSLSMLLKAGITNDKRWIETNGEFPPVTQWRLLLCYAHQEGVMDTLQRGIRVMSLDAPDLDVDNIAYFLPDNYQQAESIQSTVGNQFASENERLVATFRHIRKLLSNRQFALRHLVELDRELRNYGCEEDELGETLKEKHLWKLACRTMQLMADLTLFDEGFMPVPPLDDRITQQWESLIVNRLTI